MACEVYGGEERPCISKKESRKIQLQHSRPCPRVDLFEENGLAASTAFDLLSDVTRTVAPLAVLLNAGSIEDARRSLSRAMSSVKTIRVQDAISRMREREARKEAAARNAEEDAARERRRVVKGLQRGHS